MKVKDELHQFTERFSQRFEEAGVKYNIAANINSYIWHGETALALEILAEQLYEYQIPISVGELENIFRLRGSLRTSNLKVWEVLDELVIG